MNALTDLSNALADLVASARPRLAAIQLKHGHHLTATRWTDDLAIASEQSLPRRDRFPAILPGGEKTEAELVGRDDGSNVALLRLASAPALDVPPAASPRTGALVLAADTRRDGEPTARLGAVQQIGPAWHSQRGGRIDAYLRLDIALSAAEEGGPVLDAAGALVGISTFGPRGKVIVIPHATLARVVPVLAANRHVPRGWLGAVLQPVALPAEVEGADGRGYLVSSVAEGGPAEKAGLMIGDILLAIGGEPIHRLGDLSSRLGPESIGTTLDFALLRGGSRLTLAVEIAERPAP